MSAHKNLFDLCARITNRGEFVYNDFNKQIITDLIYYFNGIEKTYDLTKGIGVIGKKGIGKTMLMQIFEMYVNKINPDYRDGTGPNNFRNTSVEEIKDYFRANNTIHKYGYNSEDSGLNNALVKRPKRFCINEAFVQYNEKMYGTNIDEVFTSLWMMRYELFQNNNVLTHFTSNFDTSDLKNLLDPMLYDRVKEMFNIIVLEGESFRK